MDRYWMAIVVAVIVWSDPDRQRQNSSQIPFTVLITSASLDDVNDVLSQQMDPLCFNLCNYELCRVQHS